MNSEFIKKVIEVQSELKAPKDLVNNFAHFNYRSQEQILEAVKPLLHKRGLFLTICDDLISLESRIYVKATATLSDGTDSISTVAFAREAENKPGMDVAQVTGSASSYARKYALNGLFCIDDTRDPDTLDNSVSETTAKTSRKRGKSTSAPSQPQQPDIPDLEQIIAMVKACKTKEELENIWNTYAPYYGNSEDFQREVAIHPANQQ
jgi:hypothetical protein